MLKILWQTVIYFINNDELSLILSNFAIKSPSLGKRQSILLNNFLLYNSPKIFLFALSTTDVSNEARYICVVASESCPMPSLMTDRGTLLALAALAHEWRATYMVNGCRSPSITERFFRRLFTRCRALSYCLRSLPLSLMIGSRYSVSFSVYLFTMSSIHLSHLMVSCCPVFLRRYVSIPLSRSDFLRYAISTKDMPRV